MTFKEILLSVINAVRTGHFAVIALLVILVLAVLALIVGPGTLLVILRITWQSWRTVRGDAHRPD